MTCGKGWHGQLGHGDFQSLAATAQTLSQPKVIDALRDRTVVKVYGGDEVSGALDGTFVVGLYRGLFTVADEGNVFLWGDNSKHQLGQEDKTPSAFPVLLEALVRQGIIDLSIGHGHCLALDEDGKVYAWGDNAHGQLGVGHDVKRSFEPMRVGFPST